MSTWQGGSGQPAVSSSKAMAFGVGRLLLIIQALAALAFWFLCVGNVHTANQLLGNYVGRLVSDLSITFAVLGAVAVIVGTVVLSILSASLAGRVLIVAAFVAEVYFTAVTTFYGQHLIVFPAFFAMAALGLLISILMVVTTLL